MSTVVVVMSDAPPAPPSPDELLRLPVLNVTVRRLVAAFACNELAGERDYARRRLQILGRVSWVRRAQGGVVLRLVSASGGVGVRCCFTLEHVPMLAGLARGEEVVVNAVYVGMEGREVRVVGVPCGAPLARSGHAVAWSIARIPLGDAGLEAVQRP